MTKAELRAQGIQALAQVTTPIIKLPIKIRRQCGHCGDFNSVLVEPGQISPRVHAPHKNFSSKRLSREITE
jgi:hypothetical protein